MYLQSDTVSPFSSPTSTMFTKPWMQVHPAEAVKMTHRNDVCCSQVSCMLIALLSMVHQLHAEEICTRLLGMLFRVCYASQRS